MPMIDVSDAILDPMLASRFSVIRRKEDINSFGETTVTDTTIPNVIGVVTPANDQDLQRLTDQQRMGRAISIVTKFRLAGPTPDGQPDLIEWLGDQYVIGVLDPLPQYGAGFVEAIAVSMDYINQPVPEAQA